MSTRLSRRGITLVIAMAVLILMVFLSFTFVILAHMEVDTTHNSLYGLRAQFTAQSGFDFALAQLQTFARQRTIPGPFEGWIYHGEDLNMNGRLDREGTVSEDVNHNGVLDVNSCPLENALLPSFPRRTFILDGAKPLIVSGTLASSAYGIEDLFRLKVVDTSSLICLNNFENYGLKRLLNNLGQLLNIPEKIGDTLFKRRPSEGTFSDYDQVRQALGDETFQKILPYITLFCWKDHHVIRPNFETGRRRTLKEGEAIYTWSQLKPGPLETEARAPINVNLAEPIVLEAALSGLSGMALVEDLSPNVSFPSPALKNHQSLLNFFFHHLKQSTPSPIGTLHRITISLATAKKVVEAIRTQRLVKKTRHPSEAAFYTWQEFKDFLNSLVRQGTLSPYQSDLIYAQANPNTDLNPFNPNEDLYKTLDKSYLLNYTTEFTLMPMGIFEIESLGIILKKKVVMAQKKVRGVVKIFDVYRETTQADFQKGWISPVNLREGSPREHAPPAPFDTDNGLTLQTFPEPAYGSTITDGNLQLSTLSNMRYLDPHTLTFYAGFTPDWHQSYPVDTSQSHAGSLSPLCATYSNGRQDWVPDSVCFQAECRPWSSHNSFSRVTDCRSGERSSSVTYYPNTHSLFDPDSPGTLYPDGAYSESSSTPTYWAKGNFPEEYSPFPHPSKPDPSVSDSSPGDQNSSPTLSNPSELQEKQWSGVNPNRWLEGTLSFWMRPWFSSQSQKVRTFFSMTRLNAPVQGLTDPGDLMPRVNFFDLFYLPLPLLNHLGENLSRSHTFSPFWFWEHPSVDEFIVGADRTKVTIPSLFSAHQWVHLALVWNTHPDSPGTDQSGGPAVKNEGRMARLYVNGIDVTRDVYYPYENQAGWATGALDYTTNNVFRFGGRLEDVFLNFPADATFDEILLSQKARSAQSIQDEFLRGRYYPLGDGVYISRYVPFHEWGGESIRRRLGTISWTDNVSLYSNEAHSFFSLIQAQILDSSNTEQLERPIVTPSGAPLDVSLSHGFRYKIAFKTNVQSGIGPPFLDTIILDDVTLTILTPLNRQILFFTEE